MKHQLISALAAAGLFCVPVASAQSAEAAIKAFDLDPRFSKTVDISVFDLNTLDGVARAHRRIASTAYQVCSPILSTVAADQKRYRACIAESVEEAIGRADQANLSSFHWALPERARSHIWKPAPTDWEPVTS